MVKINIPLLSFKAIGKLGGFTYLRRRRIDIVEKTPVVPDARSEGQLSWRTMYQKCTALWHLLSAAEKAVWESQARPRHMTGYAWFQSQCLRPNPGIYLPLQGGTMAGDIDMAGHKIEDLPDPAAAQDAATKAYHDANLPIGGYTEGARVYNDAAISIPHVTWTVLTFNSERYDTDHIHYTALFNSRLTCKTAGKYLIIGHYLWPENATGVRYVKIRKGGDTDITLVTSSATASGGVGTPATTIYDLAVNEYVELMAFQGSGAALNINSTAQYTPEFMMQRIG